MAETLPRLIVFISGSGTNLQAIIDAINGGTLKAEIALVVSNRKAAYGLARAEQANIRTLYFPLKPYTEAGKSREAYDSDLAERIAALKPDVLVLAGWMHVFTRRFLDRFPKRVINLHPALPGAFPGTQAIERTYEAYQRGDVQFGGCMVHYVIPEVDAGEVIVEEKVLIRPEDTWQVFEEKLHATERRIIVAAIQSILCVPKK